ncbi:MAG: MBL fold metallo-hydrolase [Stellaceae bacterium]
MSFDVLVLGAGDTFSDRHHTTSLVLLSGGFALGIDCPDRYRQVLREASEKSGRALTIDAIDDWLITHVHGDHMNGLEGVAFWKHFAEQKRLKLHITREVREAIWDRRLAAPMEQLWDGEKFRAMRFEDYFDSRELSWTETNVIGPFSIRIRRTIHHVPTCSIRVECEGRTLGYSSDTAFDPGLFEFFADANRIVHETNFGPAHTDYARLAALPEATRARMSLVHYSDLFDVKASVIPVLTEGDLFTV